MATNQIRDLLRRIDSGDSIDWDDVEAQSGNESFRVVLRDLRLIDLVAAAHQGLAAIHTVGALNSRPSGWDEPASAGTSGPRRWGPLQILEAIGRGAYGRVYRAVDPRLGREVALKILHHGDAGTDDAVVGEAQRLARVRHPNVVTVYGAERVAGQVGIWMELLPGRTLEQELTERGPLGPEAIAAVGRSLCGALQAVHEAGMLHRDVKAQNVIRDGAGRVVLTDLGTGRDIRDGTAALAGTPAYLAPEVLAGGPATVRSDVYSLGVLLYRLATASFPAVGSSIEALRRAHARGERRPLAEANPALPLHLRFAIERALDPNPARRFGDAMAFAAALGDARQRPEHTLSFRWMAAAAFVMAAAAAGATLAWNAGSGSSGLSFSRGDTVLITRFENRTGEAVFDGAIEYALERELSSSDSIALVPAPRVQDALGLMKRPPDTIIDRATGREVSLRDGRIKALIAGRVEKFGTTYVLTAQVVDPGDDSVVATLTESAPGQGAVLRALHRQARRVRAALGENLDRFRGPDSAVEKATTRSLKAFQLYNESYQLGRQSKWPAALALAQQVVAEDEQFASGWIWLAWALWNTQRPLDEVRSPAERALRLADSVSDWERHWIVGSYHSLTGNLAAALGPYEALLKLRPDHHYAANNFALAAERLGRDAELLRAVTILVRQRPDNLGANYSMAAQLVRQRRDLAAAEPYVRRMRELMTPEANPLPRTWLEMLPAYTAWLSGDVAQAAARVDAVARDIGRKPERVRDVAAWAAGNFYVTLGRLREAASMFAFRSDPRLREDGALSVAYVRGDQIEMRRRLSNAPMPERPSRYIAAGLIDRARQIVREAPVARVIERVPTFTAVREASFDRARGELALLDGDPHAAARFLEKVVLALRARPEVGEYQEACGLLATALQQSGRAVDAVAAIESCAAEVPPFLPGGHFLAERWMDLMVRLADEYRAAGRASEALPIERRLLTLLSVADQDFPLLVRLRARE